ncbi:MAG: hypothetical protein UE295_07275 [Acutalibacteraceae bacterium]|nr:hypothetical protein [Acutalibacteraceae bacterium]
MKSRKKFTVTNPSIIFWLYLFIVGFFVVALILNTIFSEQFPIAMCVCVTIVIFIPGIWAMLWSKVPKITVEGDKITVRKWTGFKYTFTVDDIIEVQCQSTDTSMGLDESFLIKTKQGKKVAIGTLMNGFENMASYIEKNVEQDKIHKTFKTIKRKS